MGPDIVKVPTESDVVAIVATTEVKQYRGEPQWRGERSTSKPQCKLSVELAAPGTPELLGEWPTEWAPATSVSVSPIYDTVDTADE